MRLKNKIAVITGSGSGFGEGIALRFGAEGARVVINDLNEQGGGASPMQSSPRAARRYSIGPTSLVTPTWRP